MRRRTSDHAVLQSTSSVSSLQQHSQQNGGDPAAHAHAHNGHRKASATPSLKSQRSIYSKVRSSVAQYRTLHFRAKFRWTNIFSHHAFFKMFGRALPMRRRSSSNALVDAAAEASAAGTSSEILPNSGKGGKFKSDGGLIGTAQPTGEYGPLCEVGDSAARFVISVCKIFIVKLPRNRISHIQALRASRIPRGRRTWTLGGDIRVCAINVNL